MSIVGRVTVVIVEVVDMVTMGDRLVAAARSVVVGVVGVLNVRERVLVVVAVVRVVSMTFVDVVEMSLVLDGGVPACGPMLVGVIIMDGVSGGVHGCSLL